MTQLPDAPTTQQPRSVAKNASIYLVGQVLGWAASFAVLSIIPRHLGKDAIGKFFYLQGILTLLALVFMTGGEMLLAKEAGRDKQTAARLVRSILGLRLALIPLFMTVAPLIFFLLKISSDMWGMAWIISAAMAITLIGDPLRAALVGMERAKQVSLLDITFALFPLTTVPFLHYGVITHAIALLAACLFVFLVRLYWISRIVSVRPSFDVAAWRDVIREGVPFQANTLILQLFGQINLFTLRHFANYGAIGVHSQAQRLFGTFLFVPNAFGMALLPSLSRLSEMNREDLAQIERRVIGILIVLSLPVTATLITLATPLSRLLFAETFPDIALVLQIYALAVAPMYIVTMLYQFLVATNRGKEWTRYLLLSVALYGVFAVVLIPLTRDYWHSAASGAVLATFLSELFSTGFAFYLLRTNPLVGETAGRIVRTVFATAIMGAVMWATRNVFIAVPLILGWGIFAILTPLLSLLPHEEQSRLTEMFAKLTAKLRRTP